jgi:deoxyribonuclease V
VQKELASKVKLVPLRQLPRFVAGADISFNRYSPTMHAGFVLLDTRTMEVVERAGASMSVKFPYVPGYLSFREIPPLLRAWKKLKTKPGLLLVDGQGIAHPRRLGIASHLGVLLGIPTIGCGKSRLIGTYEEPGLEAGSRTPLWHKEERIGSVLRTKNKVKPLFISPGHLVDQESAPRLVLELCAGYRLPEPTRRAHLFVNELRIASKAA